MLAYAASRPALVDRRPYPNAMLLIIGAHVAALALVMSAKMELPLHPKDPPIKVFPVSQPKTPPPNPTRTDSSRTASDNSLDRTDTNVKLPPVTKGDPSLGPKTDPGTLGGGGTLTIPEFPNIDVSPVKLGPRLLTPTSDLKPPYPQSKIDSGEEAVLTLRLKIDANGRVVAVDPVGRADAIFLEAARRYLVAHWRYKPATEDGLAVDSSTVITLHFQLDA